MRVHLATAGGVGALGARAVEIRNGINLPASLFGAGAQAVQHARKGLALRAGVPKFDRARDAALVGVGEGDVHLLGAAFSGIFLVGAPDGNPVTRFVQASNARGHVARFPVGAGAGIGAGFRGRPTVGREAALAVCCHTPGPGSDLVLMGAKEIAVIPAHVYSTAEPSRD